MQLKKILFQSIFWRGAYFISVLLLNICVARYFASEGSASIYFATAVFSFVLLFGGLSLESGMGYFASKHPSLMTGMLALSVYWTALVALLSYLLFRFFPSLLPLPGIEGSFRTFAAVSFITGNLLTAYIAAIFYSRSNFFTPNLIGVGCNVLQIVFLLIAGAGIVPFLNLGNYLYLYFAIFILQGLLLIIALVNKEGTGINFAIPGKKELKEIFRYSLTAYIANILFMLVYRVDYWFVERFCSPAELGNYIQVSKLSQLLILVPSFLASAVFPVVAGGRREEVLNGLTIMSRLSLILIGIPCLLTAVLGHVAFPFFFGSSFNLMTLPFILLIPGILSLSTLYPLTAYYAGKNRVRVNLLGSLLALVFIVVADLLVVPRFGIPAAALVSSLGYILFHAFVLYTFKQEYRTSIREFFLIRKSDFFWIRTQILKFVYRQG